MKNCFSTLFLLGFITLIPYYASAQSTDEDSVVIEETEILPSSGNRNPEMLRIAAVGDIMLGTNYPDASYLPPNDGKFLLDSVKPYLLDADIAFGNLEGTYLNTRGETSKRCKDPKKCYAFRSPEHYLSYVADAGFDLLSLANNHSGDFGPEGRKRTVELADSLGLRTAGLLDHPISLYEKDGLVYGFVAFAPNSGCLQLNDLDQAVFWVDSLNKVADIIVVSFHGGAEGSKHQHVPKGTEYYLGENRGNLRKFTHLMIDHGADLVFGHGPHVTRGMEIYKGRLIAYSLGNFATYSRFNLTGANGVCPLLLVNINRDGSFVSGEIVPIRQLGEGIPVRDPEETVVRILKKLNESDFPESAPRFLRNNVFIERQ